MSWWLMHEKNKRDEKLKKLEDHFKRFVKCKWLPHKTSLQELKKNISKWSHNCPTLQHRHWQRSEDYKEWLVEGTSRLRSKSDHVRFPFLNLILPNSYHITRQDVEKMFDELDKNFDGQLSWQEFIGEETTIERAFKLFDENNDGTISKSVSEENFVLTFIRQILSQSCC